MARKSRVAGNVIDIVPVKNGVYRTGIYARLSSEDRDSSASFNLRKIKEDKNYLFTDLDGGEWTVSGKELTEKGFCLSITEKRVAKIFIYREI